MTMAKTPDWKGVGDARPASSPEPKKGQGGHSTESFDYKGVQDSRPSSSTESEKVKIGGVGGMKD